MVELIQLLLIVFSLLVGVYFYVKSKHNYWKSLGVTNPKPELLFGNERNYMLGKYHTSIFSKGIYDHYKSEPMVGIYRGVEPRLVLRDLDLVKDVLIKDFSKFSYRGIQVFEKHEPWNLNLMNLEPKRWRQLRSKLSPIFTSGKLRNMFYLLLNCANQLDEYLDRYDNEIIDMRDIPARFATDVIGVCAFGLDTNALADENSEFRKMGKSIFAMTWKTRLRSLFVIFLPLLYRYLFGYFLKNQKLQDFIIGITKQSMEYRKKNNINRHDFIDLLMSLKDQPKEDIDDIELDDKLLAAQLFIFFAAGFETSSTTMANALYELAKNHSIQDKLRQEIKDELAKTDGKLTYDGIKNMKYLDQVFKETLRKYPPAAILPRKSVAPYELAGTGIKIPANTVIWIPIFAIQRDPQYFSKPDVFDPERFSEENVKKRHDMTFLSFGDGPRNCIGARFGTIQTKVGLIKILQRHTVDVCEKTDLDYEIEPRAFLLTPKNGIFLRINKVN